MYLIIRIHSVHTFEYGFEANSLSGTVFAISIVIPGQSKNGITSLQIIGYTL